MATLFPSGAIPVGAIIPFGGPISAIPDGFLLCNGAEINRNDFSELFAVIDEYWGNGNGTTTFNLPTTQGVLLRGQANGSANDPDRNSRTGLLGAPNGDNVGSFQNYRVESHRHLYRFRSSPVAGYVNGLTTATGNGYNTGAYGPMLFSNANPIAYAFNGNVNNNNSRGAQAYTFNTGSSQTVGVNVSVNFIIKY